MKCSIFFMVLLMSLLVFICTGAPIAAAEEVKVKISFQGDAQVELISPEGSRVFIDVWDPSRLSSPATEKDILLTTHTHGDHYNREFLQSFPGQSLFVREGTIKTVDVFVQSIASSHDFIKAPQPEKGSNYIFFIEMGGLRIAHFGDIGQDALTDEQLKKLGKVDIAITQLDNVFSEMNCDNKKGFKLMDQVKPMLVIPAHTSLCAMKFAGTKWPSLYSNQKFISIGRGDLTDKTRIIFLGSMAEMWAEMTKAVKVNW